MKIKGKALDIYKFFDSTPLDEEFAKNVDDATEELRKNLRLRNE